MRTIIAGPCVIEHSAQWLVDQAGKVKEIFDASGVAAELVFKASLDKANRSTLDGRRGIGFQEGLEALADVRTATGLRVTTDFHEPWQVYDLARGGIIPQVPAMLARQTDILVSAARSYAQQVSIKMPVWADVKEMLDIEAKYTQTREKYKLAVTVPWTIYRGTQHGPGKHNLFVNYPLMSSLLWAFKDRLFLDLTHTNDGDWQVSLKHAAEYATDVAGFFMEAHPAPAQAWCDGKHQLSFPKLAVILDEIAPKFSGGK